MKKLPTIVLFSFLSVSLLSQIPQSFKYQAVVRDAAGEVLQNQAVGIQISIHDETAGGTIIYQETFTATTNDFGLVNLEIGTGTPSIGSFSTIPWRTNSKFLEVAVDLAGGSTYVSMGTSQLLSGPYALHSETSDDDGDWTVSGNNLYTSHGGNVGIGTSNPVAKLDVAGNVKMGQVFEMQFDPNDLDHFQINPRLKVSGFSDTIPLQEWGDGGVVYTRIVRKVNNHMKMTTANWLGYNFGFEGDYEFEDNVSFPGPGIWNSSGNIGIGTTTPNSKLTFSNHFDDGFDEWTDYKILLYTNPTPQTSYGIGKKIGTFAFNTHYDYDFDQQGVTKMTIKEGNVGIGTTTPTCPLQVYRNSTNFDYAASFEHYGTQYNRGVKIRAGSNIYADFIDCYTGVNNDYRGSLKYSSGALSLYTYSDKKLKTNIKTALPEARGLHPSGSKESTKPKELIVYQEKVFNGLYYGFNNMASIFSNLERRSSFCFFSSSIS